MGKGPNSDSANGPGSTGRGAGQGGEKTGVPVKRFFGSARKTVSLLAAAVVGPGGVTGAVFGIGQEGPQNPRVIQGLVTTFPHPRPPGFRNASGVKNRESGWEARLDKRFSAGLPTDAAFKLYQEDALTPATGLAVFDEGSLSLLGATGVAELGDPGGCNGHTWPVARQGNDLFWGYSLPGTALTSQGALLFENVVLAVLHDDFQQPFQQQHYKDPGSYPGDALGCLFSTNEYRLPVSATGAIKVVVKSTREVLLSAAGPRALDSYSVHGISPTLLIPWTPQSLDAGQDWVITLSYSAPMHSRTRIDYDFTLSYPSQDASPGRALLLTLLLLLTCLLGVLSTVYIARARHLVLPVGKGICAIWPWRPNQPK